MRCWKISPSVRSGPSQGGCGLAPPGFQHCLSAADRGSLLHEACLRSGADCDHHGLLALSETAEVEAVAAAIARCRCSGRSPRRLLGPAYLRLEIAAPGPTCCRSGWRWKGSGDRSW